MELRELIVGAQEAMEGGDFRLALAANAHALKAYPACLASHRMMGEAYLERGDRDSAVTHFERTLQIDPLNVVARLGLGVAAEETKDFQAAYAHYLHAWEINPALDQVRDELVRLRGLLNVDERLHPTRAGLAGIHARAGQFRRSVGEWRAVLAVEPESRRGRTALAELLWRGSDDAGAAQAAREALRGSPENARALAILADVERRRNGADAEEIAHRYAEVDPTGEMIEILQPWRIDADLSFLRVDSAALDDFDLEASRSRDTGPLGVRKTVTASLANSQLSAPDLWDTLVQDLTTEIPSTSHAPTVASGVEPFNWNENGSPQDSERVAAQSEAMVDLADQLFGGAEADSPESEGSVTSDHSDEDSTESAIRAEAPVAAGIVSAVAAPAENPIGMNQDHFDELIRSMATDDQMAEATVTSGVTAGPAASAWPPESQPISTVSYVHPVPLPSASQPLADLVDRPSGNRPGDEPVGPAEPVSNAGMGGEYLDPFVTADGQIDLTQGWDDLDRALADATPTLDGAEGFDTLLADLDGIQPFDAVSEDDPDDAWAPLFDDHLVADPVASAPSADASGPVDLDAELKAGAGVWFDDADAGVAPLTLPAEDEIQPPAPIDTYPSVIEAVVETTEPRDATGDLLDFADLEAFDATPFLAEAEEALAIEPEIVTGIPGAQPSGYTELLRNVDEESSAVSELYDAELDPFAIPDGAGAPLEVDELLEVTSSDGTGPLAAEVVADLESIPELNLENPFDFEAADLEAALPMAMADDLALELDGIVPFDSTAFSGTGAGDGPVEFDEIDGPIQEPAAELDIEPIAPEIQPFGYTDALSVAEGEPFDFSDVVVEVEPETGNESGIFGDAAALAPTEGELESEAIDDGSSAKLADVAHAELHQPGWAGKEGLGTVARKVLWPQFVNQTSELIDRALGTDDLFERIAASKQAMLAQGLISSNRRVKASAAVANAEDQASHAISDEPPKVSRSAAPEMSEQTRLDLMAMRIRLVEDDEAATEIADALEQALAEGLASPLALRVLGEAYLKMGLVERAAALFRQAMLARRRVSLESR